MGDEEEKESGLPRGCAPRNDETGGESGRIVPNKHRALQVRRTGGRKLFDEAAKAVFLEWFAATCNGSWSAEMAGFNYKTVLRHRMNDERFAEAWDRAVRQGYARLEAKRLETKKRALPIGIEGDFDAPDMDEMDPARMDAILRERGREIGGVRKQGRRPRAASNSELFPSLVAQLAAFGARVAEEDRAAALGGEEEKGGGKIEEGTSAPGPLHHPPTADGPPPRSGEEL